MRKEPTKRRPWSLALALLAFAFASIAAWTIARPTPEPSGTPDLVAHVVPPPGPWTVTTLTGAIDIEAGGSAVLCQQGNARRRAVTEATGFTSRLNLRESSPTEGSFVFEMAFVRGDDIDIFSNGVRATIPSQGQHPVGSPAQSTRHGTWSWDARVLEGGVSSRTDPSDTSGSSPELNFALDGRFESPTKATGTWSFREVAGLGACWSRAQGDGTWAAEFDSVLKKSESEPPSGAK